MARRKLRTQDSTTMQQDLAAHEPKTISDRLKAIEDLEAIEVPWFAGKRLGLTPTLFGSQIAFTDDGDYLNRDDVCEALQWWVQQLGGSVTWTE